MSSWMIESLGLMIVFLSHYSSAISISDYLLEENLEENLLLGFFTIIEEFSALNAANISLL